MEDRPRPIRILICDDQWVVRLGLRANLSQQGDTEVVGEAANGKEAVGESLRLRPDVVLMDLQMPEFPDFDGADATAAIVEKVPETNVVIFSQYDAASDVLRAMEAGPKGFVFKYDDADELHAAVRKVAAGGSHLASKAAVRLLEQLQGGPDILSSRHLEILQLVSQGMTASAIARRLDIKEGTVKDHLTNIFHKLGAIDRTSAVVEAHRRGLIRF